MKKQITLDNNDCGYSKKGIANPNIILRKGSKYPYKLFKNVNCVHCVSCNTDFPFNTAKKFYLLNSHGWGFCKDCMEEIKSLEVE